MLKRLLQAIKKNNLTPRKVREERIFLCLFIIGIMLAGAWGYCFAETPPAIWKVLLAEASNQGYDGLYAVACVIRNRGGKLNGFMGAHRKDLDAFCNRQGKRYIEMAKRIETIVFKNNGQDITNGATHFENIQKFGEPYWAKKMDKVAVIGSHIFYRERR